MNDTELRERYMDYVAAINARELDRMHDFVAESVVVNGQRGTVADVLAGLNDSIDAVPDLEWEVTELSIDGDRVGVRALNRGTPAKEWLGVAPTGKGFEVTEFAIYRMSEGRFVEMTYLHDSADLRRQLEAGA